MSVSSFLTVAEITRCALMMAMWSLTSTLTAFTLLGRACNCWQVKMLSLCQQWISLGPPAVMVTQPCPYIPPLSLLPPSYTKHCPISTNIPHHTPFTPVR